MHAQITYGLEREGDKWKATATDGTTTESATNTDAVQAVDEAKDKVRHSQLERVGFQW